MRSHNMDDLQIIQDKIYEIHGQRVMLDRDLAEMYGVEQDVSKNGWLTWNGERVAGWVYPKSYVDKLDKYLPADISLGKSKFNK